MHKELSVITPALRDEISSLSSDTAVHAASAMFIARRTIGKTPESEPSMVFAGPEYNGEIEDGGRSVKIKSPITFWLKRDDYPPDCDPALPNGGMVFTYLKPEDY